MRDIQNKINQMTEDWYDTAKFSSSFIADVHSYKEGAKAVLSSPELLKEAVVDMFVWMREEGWNLSGYYFTNKTGSYYSFDELFDLYVDNLKQK